MKMALLEGPSLKQEEVIKMELGEGTGDLERGVRDLRNMLAASPHLPEPDSFDDHFLELFVRGCRMDRSRARTKLEAFSMSRSRCRDLYEHRSLTESPLKDVCNFMDIVLLPKLTDEGYRVTIYRVKADYPDTAADFLDTVRAILLVADARMREETLIAGDVFIFELTHCRMSLSARVVTSINAIRRGIHLAQAAYPQRLKRVHVIGCSPVFANPLQLILKCVNEKVRRRYLFHETIDEILEHVPSRILPMEWGGEEDSIEVLAKKLHRHIDDNRDFLRNLNEACDTDPHPVQDAEIYGTAGAFRKLDID